jgi:hypothetical protein
MIYNTTTEEKEFHKHLLRTQKLLKSPKGSKLWRARRLHHPLYNVNQIKLVSQTLANKAMNRQTKNNQQDPFGFTIANKNTGPPQPAVSNHEASGWVDPFASNSHLPPQQGEPHQDFFGGFSQPQPQPNSAVKQFWEEDTPPKAPSTSQNHYLPSQPVQHPVVHPQLPTHPTATAIISSSHSLHFTPHPQPSLMP